MLCDSGGTDGCVQKCRGEETLEAASWGGVFLKLGTELRSKRKGPKWWVVVINFFLKACLQSFELLEP